MYNKINEAAITLYRVSEVKQFRRPNRKERGLKAWQRW